MISTLLISATSSDPLVDWLKSNFTGTAMGALMIVGFIRGWIVPGTTFNRVLGERDKALELVYTLAEAARRAVEAGEKKGGS